jgi:hypothetical protein
MSSEQQWRDNRSFIEPTVIAAQRLQAVARTMPTDELREAYIAVERLIMAVVRGSDDPDAPDPWHADVAGPQPDTITRAVNATADAIKHLYTTYPDELVRRVRNGFTVKYWDNHACEVHRWHCVMVTGRRWCR